MKPDAILTFSLGEFYWEFGRFAPYVLWKRLNQYKNRKDINFIVMTDPTRFDIYGKHASILVPFRLKNNNNYKENCFRLDGMSNEEYLSIIDIFKNQFKDRYNILEVVYPNINKKQFLNKNQFHIDKTNYSFLPRKANKVLVEKIINNEKPIVILAPRYREGMRRNWPYWNELYDLIFENKELIDKYNFVICGKKPDYVPDLKNRFLDINLIEQNINTSLIGLTIELMKRAVLTIGSQSAIPNISLLLGVPALEWGNQKQLHTITYNIRNTEVTFLEDNKFNISQKIIYDEMLKILSMKRK